MPAQRTKSMLSFGPSRPPSGAGAPSSRRAAWRALAWTAAGAASLGGLALVNGLLARRSEARHPPEGKFLTVGGVRLHYREAGEGGPVVVLLHGNGAASDDFLVSGVLGRLARTARVIAFDRPGFGYSERPRGGGTWSARRQARLLLQAVEALGVERPVVVGHSWGALVAAEMGLAARDALAGVVLISGYYRPTARPDAWLLSGPALPVAGKALAFTTAPLFARLITPAVLRQLFAPAPVDEHFRRTYPISQSLRPAQLRASAAESALMTPSASAFAPRVGDLRLPVLVIAGADDRLVDARHQSAWLARALPNAVYRPLAGAGHMVHHTASEAVASAIEQFVQSVASAPPLAAVQAGGSPAVAGASGQPG